MLILGGAKGLGRWIAENTLIHDDRLTLTLADIDPSIVDVAEELSKVGQPGSVVRGRHISFQGSDVVEGIDAVSRFDVILVCVPIEAVDLVARSILSHTRSGALIVDICSLKSEPLETIAAHAPKGTSIVGTHPLFGPPLASAAGQTVVVCKTETSNEIHVKQIEGIIKKQGAIAKYLTPEAHDQQMRIIQALPHFVVLTVGEVLQSEKIDLSSVLHLQTPPFRALSGLLGRILGLRNDRQAELYASIQHSPYAATMREGFLGAAQGLHNIFNERSLHESRIAIESIAQSLPRAAVEQCAAQAGEAISSRLEVDRRLVELSRSQDVCAFRHQDGRTKVGRILEVDPTTIWICGEIIERNGEKAVVYDDESRYAASLLGMNGTSKCYHLPRRHYQLLPDSDCVQWRQRELKHHCIDLTFGLPTTLNAVAMCRYLESLVPEILSCKLIGTAYTPKPGANRRVTFRLKSIGDRSPERAKHETVEFIESVGGDGPSRA